MNDQPVDQERKRRIRRNVTWLTLLALAFYVAFIALNFRG